MVEDRIQVGISDEYLDTTKIVQDETGLFAHREAVFVADPVDPTAKTNVRNATPGALDYGVVSRPIIEGGTLDEISNVTSVDTIDTLTSITNPVTTTPTGAAAANRLSSPSFNGREAATLAAGATFQGVGEDVTGYGRVGIVARSDNATDGVLTIEVSEDNVRWGGPTRDWADTRFATPHMWNIVEPYFRIKYVNGTTEAANLSIVVQYSNNADVVLGHQLNEILPQESEATLVRPGSSFPLEAARSHITGNNAEFFIGHNSAFSTIEDIWATGGTVPWSSSAVSLEVLSTNANDDGTGTPLGGLHSVEIHGLDATGADQEEVVVLNGTTPVALANTYTRINKMHSQEAGTYGGSHQGNITLRIPSGATWSTMTGNEGVVNSSIQYGSGESGNGFYTVPLGKVLYITQLAYHPDVSANKSMTIKLYEREDILNTADTFGPRREIWGVDAINTGDIVPFPSHIKIKPLTDIWFRATATNTSALEVSLDFYLVDEDSAGK